VRASRLGGNLELGILEDEEFVDEEFVDFFFGFDSVTGDEELVEEEKEKRHSLREREKRQSLGSQEDEERPISSASTGLPSSRDTPDTQRNFRPISVASTSISAPSPDMFRMAPTPELHVRTLTPDVVVGEVPPRRGPGNVES
jgi:hypothetical protein